MSNYTLVDDKDVPDGTVIPDGGWALQIDKVIVGVNTIKFAEEENEDKTMNVEIDYDILNYDDLDDVPDDLDSLIGDCVMEMLEDAIKVKEMKRAIKEAEDAKDG